jgi:hypothetical protein
MTARPEPPPSAEELSALRDKLCRRRENLVHQMVHDGIEAGYLTQLAGVQAAMTTIDLMTGNNHRSRRWS